MFKEQPTTPILMHNKIRYRESICGIANDYCYFLFIHFSDIIIILGSFAAPVMIPRCAAQESGCPPFVDQLQPPPRTCFKGLSMCQTTKCILVVSLLQTVTSFV
jgi:hypothetical protein